jgi:hypothetical protein
VTGRRLLPAVLGIACLAFLLGVSTRAGDLERPVTAGQKLDAVMAQQPSAVVTNRDPAGLFRSHRSRTAPVLVMAVLLAALVTAPGWSRRVPILGTRTLASVGAAPASARAPPR